jgi:hypothetical protein
MRVSLNRVLSLDSVALTDEASSSYSLKTQSRRSATIVRRAMSTGRLATWPRHEAAPNPLAIFSVHPACGIALACLRTGAGKCLRSRHKAVHPAKRECQSKLDQAAHATCTDCAFALIRAETPAVPAMSTALFYRSATGECHY